MSRSSWRRWPLGVTLYAVIALLTVACGTPAAAPAAPTAAPQATAIQPPAPTATNTSTPPKEVTVFAASSLTDVFKEIGAAFEKETPSAKLVFNFGASSMLRAQFEQGAKADVFASANQTEMTNALNAKVISGQPAVFARNRLALIVPKDNPGKITDLKDLSRKGLKVVTTDKGVPIGQYTLDMLEKMSKDAAYGQAYKDGVTANFVSYEANVRQVVSKVALGEADAGVSYTTDVTPDFAPKITAIDVPDAFNTIATYPIAVVNSGSAAELGGKFMAFVTSKSGQDILKKSGFILP